MTMRFALPEDAAALALLHATAFPPSEAWNAAAFASLLQLHGVFGLMQPEEGVPLGLILARVMADEAEILTLAVDPTARREGHGDALVETAVLHAAAMGAATMFLEVAEDNVAALALYAGLGFGRPGHRRDYYSPGRHALVLRRKLRGD